MGGVIKGAYKIPAAKGLKEKMPPSPLETTFWPDIWASAGEREKLWLEGGALPGQLVACLMDWGYWHTGLSLRMVSPKHPLRQNPLSEGGLGEFDLKKKLSPFPWLFSHLTSDELKGKELGPQRLREFQRTKVQNGTSLVLRKMA